MTAKIVVMASGAGTNFGAVLDAISRGVLHAEVVALVVNRKDAGARLLAEKAGIVCHYMPLAPYRSATYRSASSHRPGGKRGGIKGLNQGLNISNQDYKCVQSYHWAEDAERLAYDADLAEVVGRASPDLVVLAGWMHLLSPVFLDCFPRKVINLHPALPGHFPGNNAIEDAWKSYRKTLESSQTLESLSPHPADPADLHPPDSQSAHPHLQSAHPQSVHTLHAELAGTPPTAQGTPAAHTGVMVHYVTDAGVDNGYAIDSVEVPIYPSDTLDVLRLRMRAAEHKLLVSAISEVLL